MKMDMFVYDGLEKHSSHRENIIGYSTGQSDTGSIPHKGKINLMKMTIETLAVNVRALGLLDLWNLWNLALRK